MVGESGTSRNGAIHRYYKGSTVKNRKGCNKKSVKKDWIENEIIERTVKLLFDDVWSHNVTEAIMDLQDKESTTLPLLNNQLAETKKSIENILAAIQQGVFTKSTKSRLEELEEKERELGIEILLEEIGRPQLTREFIHFFFDKYRQMDLTTRESQQRLVDGFVNAIYMHDDRIIIIYNYKDGTETIMLKDIECSDIEGGGEPFFCP
jgi:hypothetical protein